jgi:hypothetical protein
VDPVHNHADQDCEGWDAYEQVKPQARHDRNGSAIVRLFRPDLA